MIFTVDVGNSNIVLGGVQGDEIVFEARLRTDATKTSDEYCIDLKMILEVYHLNSSDIEGSIIASVVPQVSNSMQTAIRKLTGKTPLVVGPGLKTGLNIAIDNPAQTGADLVVGCVAALREHKAPMIIIDMGTATTMMVLDKNSAMIGGAIIPGVRISMDALTRGTSLLPRIEILPPNKVIATNTVECMKAGIIFGSAGAIDGVLDRFTESLQATGDEEWSIVATGGLAGTICPSCRHKITIDDNLLLKGLRIIWEKNRGSRRTSRS